MLILGLLGMYFDAVLVFVTSQTLFLRLALAILCPELVNDCGCGLLCCLSQLFRNIKVRKRQTKVLQ